MHGECDAPPGSPRTLGEAFRLPRLRRHGHPHEASQHWRTGSRPVARPWRCGTPPSRAVPLSRLRAPQASWQTPAAGPTRCRTRRSGWLTCAQTRPSVRFPQEVGHWFPESDSHARASRGKARANSPAQPLLALLFTIDVRGGSSKQISVRREHRGQPATELPAVVQGSCRRALMRSRGWQQRETGAGWPRATPR